MKIDFIKQGFTTLAVAAFMIWGFSSAATGVTTSTKTLVGVPIQTFCSVYAKDVATKSVAISLIIKIKDNPLLKSSLMRQYATFITLGKQYCRGQYAPEMYGFTPMVAPVSPTSIDISQNTPIINTVKGNFTSAADYFTGYDTTLLAGLTQDQLTMTLQRISKAKEVYAEIVEKLIGQWFLTAADRDEMVGKVAFTFSNNCNQLDGKILVRYWSDSNDKFVESELIEMLININLCFTGNYQANFETFLDKIIYHELGHYFDYFHDMDTDGAFRNICWSGKQNICSTNDFVSTYALTSADEDYAETFSYFEQMSNSPPPTSTKLQQKLDYFKLKKLQP